jgi:thiamine-monophosphate kinase
MRQRPMDERLLSEIGEPGVIDRARRAAGRRRAPLILGIGDDAALISPPPGKMLSLTCDMMIEGVHFRRDWSEAGQVGSKAAAVNLSDIAAMGGTPAVALVSLAAPADLAVGWIDEFFAGLTTELLAFGCQLAGGDTVGSPGPIVVDVTVAGFQETAARRQGARPGDVLVLTGPVGGAAAGLALLEAGERWPGSDARVHGLLAAQLMPHPRVAESQVLVSYAHAMTDLSDGLSTSLELLTRPKGLGARIDQEQIPMHPGLGVAAERLQRDPEDWMREGGEEYELLAAVAPRRVPALWRALQRQGYPIYPIGEVTSEPGLHWRRQGKEIRVERGAFDHFDLGRQLEHPPRS